MRDYRVPARVRLGYQVKVRHLKEGKVGEPIQTAVQVGSVAGKRDQMNRGLWAKVQVL